MREALTVLAAAIISFVAVLIIQPAEASETNRFGLHVQLSENGAVLDETIVVIRKGKTYIIDLEGSSTYRFRIEAPEDTRAAALEQFERELGAFADDFLLVNTNLSFEGRPEVADFADHGKEISTSVLLRLDGREIVTDLPISEHGLIDSDGETPIESMILTLSARPILN